MNRWLYVLLLAAPAAVLAEKLHASPLATFVLASLGLVPLAGLIGLSTEVLAERLGHGIGGLLNATFGNAAEIIIGLTALAAGLPEVVHTAGAQACEATLPEMQCCVRAVPCLNRKSSIDNPINNSSVAKNVFP